MVILQCYQKRIGFIGAGFIADILARSLLLLDEYAPIEAVFSREIEKAMYFAKKYGIENIYYDWRDIVNSREVDAVIIATVYPYCFILFRAMALR